MFSMKSDTAKGIQDSAESGIAKRRQPANQGVHRTVQKPERANGLRRLYNAVVEEPLPDSFKDLLSRLDDKS